MIFFRNPILRQCVGRLIFRPHAASAVHHVGDFRLALELGLRHSCSARFLLCLRGFGRTIHSSCYYHKSEEDSQGNLTAAKGLLKEGEDAEKVTEAEWRQRLTDLQYYVCREHGTEMPFSGKYLSDSKLGIYCCVCCGSELFSSGAKYDSKSGWPSFFEALDDKNLIHKVDKTGGMKRIEVLCQKCNSHLGHVFDDGPAPTGQRYCINSVALDFTATK